MELKAYSRIVVKRWWIPLLSFGVLFLATFALTSRQPNIYETKATFVIRPRSEIVLDDEFVRALDMVSRRVEINTTFAEVANSKLIKNLAIDRLGLSSEERQGLSVNGRVIGGTNILEITGRGRDPGIARDFANAVGVEIVNYVASLYDVFELQPLDEASVPSSHVTPNLFLNLALSAVLGLGLGVGLVFLIGYLETPHQEQWNSFNIIDRETGAYNKSYLMHRLWQELSRARRNKYPLSLGMIKVESGEVGEDYSRDDRVEALRLVKTLAEKSLREEDIMARFDDEALVVLLPDMSERKAQTFMDTLRFVIASVPQDVGGSDGKLQLKCAAGVVSYQNYRMKQERFLDQAFQSLKETAANFEEEEVLLRVGHKGENGVHNGLPLKQPEAKNSVPKTEKKHSDN